MILKIFNALDNAVAPPAEAETPNRLGQLEAEIQQGIRYGVPPSGGRTHANMMTLKTFNTLGMADVSPAKAGTPYGAEIQQGMKELEGMLK